MKWPEIIAQSSAVRQQLDRLLCTLRSLLARGIRRVRHCYKLAAELCSLLFAGQPIVPLVFKLAAKNLFHDRLRFIATIVGIVFSIVSQSMGAIGLFTKTSDRPAPIGSIPQCRAGGTRRAPVPPATSSDRL